MSGRFVVDLDQLADVIAHLTAQHDRMAELADRVAAESSHLHAGWEGRASEAHLGADAHWQSGCAQMREALTAMTAAAAAAGRNYTGAAAANVRMWRSLG